MADYVIQDDVLAPKGVITIEYYGPNPFAIYPRIPGLLQRLYEARGVHYYEDEFRWDIAGDPNVFFILCHLDKGLDKWTRGFVYLKIWGAQPVDPNTPTGRLKIEINVIIRTEYPIVSGTLDKKLLGIPHFIVMPFIILYHWFWYNNIRRQYMRRYKERTERLETELRRTLNLMMRARLT